MNNRVYYTSGELLKKIAEGDQHAFRTLFDRKKTKLYKFLRNLISSKADAEEILQETFIKIWESAHNIHSVECPDQYIYRIARNKTLNHLRSAGRTKARLDRFRGQCDYADHSLENNQYYSEYQQLIGLAIDQLPAKKKEVFQLSRYHGWSHEEIALYTGLSRSRVKNILTDSLKFIRNFLTAHG